MLEKIPTHISNNNQNISGLPKSQKKALFIRFSTLKARLNLVLPGMLITKSNQDVSAQLIFFFTIYTNYNHKPLPKVRKLEISWNKFKKLALKIIFKVFQEEKGGEKKVLICIFVKMRELVLMLMMNSGICL